MMLLKVTLNYKQWQQEPQQQYKPEAHSLNPKWTIDSKGLDLFSIFLIPHLMLFISILWDVTEGGTISNMSKKLRIQKIILWLIKS